MDNDEMRLEALDLNQQGKTLLKVGKVEEAKKKFDKANEIDPMLMDSYKNYGDLYMQTEQFEDAKNSYKKAMLIEKSGLLYFLYGNACFMNDEDHEGLENYNLAINEGYDSDDMLFFMGLAYENMNENDLALRFYQKACVKNPSKPEYMVKKIVVLIKLGMKDEALKTTDELLERSPEIYDGYHIKTQLLMEYDRYDEAVKFAKKASDRFPEDPDLIYDYAKALSLNNQSEESLKVIKQAKQMKYFEDSKRDFLFLEAELYAKKAQYDLAKEKLLECIAMETENAIDGEARFMLMNFYIIDKDYEKSLEQANALVKTDAKDLYYHSGLYYRALSLKNLGKTEEATHFYKEASSIYRLYTLKNPIAIDVYLYRAMCMKDLEQYDQALELLDFINSLDDQVAEIYTLKAEIYRILGRKALEEEEMKKAYKLKPELKELYESDGE